MFGTFYEIFPKHRCPVCFICKLLKIISVTKLISSSRFIRTDDLIIMVFTITRMSHDDLRLIITITVIIVVFTNKLQSFFFGSTGILFRS